GGCPRGTRRIADAALRVAHRAAILDDERARARAQESPDHKLAADIPSRAGIGDRPLPGRTRTVPEETARPPGEPLPAAGNRELPRAGVADGQRGAIRPGGAGPAHRHCSEGAGAAAGAATDMADPIAHRAPAADVERARAVAPDVKVAAVGPGGARAAHGGCPRGTRRGSDDAGRVGHRAAVLNDERARARAQ